MRLSVSAQTNNQIEADLMTSFKKIVYWGTHRGNPINIAKLENANNQFARKLKSYSEKYPHTIVQNFKLLKSANLSISTSKDSLFRIYSWDTETGGTMHWFENVFQYKIGFNAFAVLDTPKTEGDARPYYQKVFTLNINGKKYYLATWLAIGSTKDMATGIHVFTINSNKLVDARIIKTQTGFHDEIAFGYDLSLLQSDRIPIIEFNEDKTTIAFPLIKANGKLTHQLITYKFNGRYFEKIK